MTGNKTSSETAPGRQRDAGRLATIGLSCALLAAGLAGIATTTAQSSSVAMVTAASQDTTIGTYRDTKSQITVTKRVTGSGSDAVVAFIADITLTEGTSLRSAFAKDSFAKNSTETVSAMAKRKNAVLAVNGDYSSFRMTGIVISDGVSYLSKGTRAGLAVMRDGSAKVYDETTTNAADLLADKVWQTQSFGPGLVADGSVVAGIDQFEIADFGPVKPGAPGSIQGNQPRTGIGMVEKNHFVMIAVDGRNANGSRGAKMTEFAQLFVGAGAKIAYNLDGGGSETMYFNGQVVNKPSGGSERATSNMLYIGK